MSTKANLVEGSGPHIMGTTVAADTIVDAAHRHARCTPDRTAFTFLVDGEQGEAELTFGQLDQRARQIAAALHEQVSPGSRALLAFNPGLDYITALYGCLYAGVVAVPAYPPRPQSRRTAPRFQAILDNAEAALILTSSDLLNQVGAFFDQFRRVGLLRCDAIDTQPVDHPWAAEEDQVAILQYTSGSTGVPRGVAITHQNLKYCIDAINSLDPDDPLTMIWAPPYHDMGLVGGLLQSVFRGSRALLMSPQAFFQKPLRWLTAISKYKVASSAAPNFGYELCLSKIAPGEEDGLDLSSWRIAINGAEPVRATTLDRFAERFGRIGFRREAFVPAYGLAEATLMVSCCPRECSPRVTAFSTDALQNGRAVPDTEGSAHVSAGACPAGTKVVIVDPETECRKQDGEVGEIWIHGPAVGNGYWRDEDKTRQTFGGQLHGESPACNYLRSGDLGFIHDGELFISGRSKDLIILGGRNYHPGDIEQVVEGAHAALVPSGGAAFSIDVEDTERLVVVHEVSRPRRHDLDEVIRCIRRDLAREFELAVDAVVLITPGSLPRTSSGKVQRGECRQGFQSCQLRVVHEWVCEQAAVESSAVDGNDASDDVIDRLRQIWSSVLALDLADDVDDAAGFLELGGHSLLAMQILSRVQEAFGVELPVRELFEAGSLERLADTIRERQLGASEQLPAVVPADRTDAPPLSFAQERMWFVQQIQPEAAAYNVSIALQLTGSLNRELMLGSMQKVVDRHEVLRTRFEVHDGSPRQVIDAALELRIDCTDLQHLAPQAQGEQLDQLAGRAAGMPFDLVNGPLIRIHCFELAADRCVLLATMHHSICDAWSLGIFIEEWTALYRAGSAAASPTAGGAALPQLCVQYADFAIRQRSWLQGSVLEEQLSYWRTRLADLPVMQLPTDRARPSEQRMVGSRITVPADSAVLDDLRELSRREGVTLAMTLLAVFQMLMYRLTNTTDIPLGMPVANRRWPSCEGLIGTFVNTLVIRGDLSGEPTFRECLSRVRDVVLDAFAHQDMPFEKLVSELQPARDASYGPLAQVVFNYINLPHVEVTLPDVETEMIPLDRGASQFDLMLSVIDTLGVAELQFEYDTELFDAETIHEFIAQYQKLLTSVVAHPDQPITELAGLADTNRSRVAGWNDTSRDYGHDLAHELFTDQASRTPDKVALSFRQQTLTYRELNVQADALAAELRRRGAGRGTCVGIHMHRSIEMVVAVLGVLKSGAAYVPLDPHYPHERLRFMGRRSHAVAILTQPSLAAGLPASLASSDSETPAVLCVSCPAGGVQIDEAEGRPSTLNVAVDAPCPVSSDDLCYVIFTSGSTGDPKGVEVPHGAFANLLRSMAEAPGFSDDDVLLSVTSLSFDISGLELLLPLIQGGTLALVDDEAVRDARQLATLIADTQATVMQATPSTWRMLCDSGWQGSNTLKALCGGEAMPRDLADQLLPRVAELWNMYGPTETTIWSTIHKIESPADAISIGRPIANTQVYIVDDQLQPVAPRVVGEIYIAGAGVAHGYINQAELTAERFLPNPFSVGEKMYRTGDLGRYRSDGTIEFLGRVDHQVKLRGFRIELEEIEARLNDHPAVSGCVVSVRRGESGDEQLVAYIVSSIQPYPETDDLRHHLAESLPAYMLPAYYVFVNAFPLTPNGKVDRAALPAPMIAGDPARPMDDPQTASELRLAGIWKQVLGLKRIGVRDDFFAVGGHSLLAVRLLAQLEQLSGKRLPLATIFKAPTIEQQAALLADAGWVPSWESLVPIRPTGNRPPIFCVHAHAGNVLGYHDLARHLGDEQPFFGLQARGLNGEQEASCCVEEMASRYLSEIRSAFPQGPFVLMGYCFGGLVAFEMARQLQAEGEDVPLLAMVHTEHPQHTRSNKDRSLVATGRKLMAFVERELLNFAEVPMGRKASYLRFRWASWYGSLKVRIESRLTNAGGHLPGGMKHSEEYHASRLAAAHQRALESYQPEGYSGRVLLLTAKRPDPSVKTLGWQDRHDGSMLVRQISGHPVGLLSEPRVAEVAAALRPELESLT